MASFKYSYSSNHINVSCLVLLVLLLSCLNKTALCFKPKHLNLSSTAIHWSGAGATWYGSPNGAGSDGGACGYGNTISRAPFSSMIAAVGPSLYKSGKECGACYKVKCTKHPSCSGRPVRVVTTDFCPGGPCMESAHFDLSGTAFGAMAKPGEEEHLRDAGMLRIRYARIACDYHGKTITFHVDMGSNSNYIAMVVEFEDGDGGLSRVELRETPRSSSTSHMINGDTDDYHQWRPMQQSWGAVWKLDAGGVLQPPLSIRLTSDYSDTTIVAKDVIPYEWKAGATYRSLVNYL